MLLNRAHSVSKLWDDAPVIVCGDFNCTPKVITFLTLEVSVLCFGVMQSLNLCSVILYCDHYVLFSYQSPLYNFISEQKVSLFFSVFDN